MERNVVGWFEIPVSNMDRAARFYEEVFGYKIDRVVMGELEMGWFPYAVVPGAPGSLVLHKEYKPSQEGALIYFVSPSGDLQNELDKIEKAGGKVLLKKKIISEDTGYMGLFVDSEGNRIAIHSTA